MPTSARLLRKCMHIAGARTAKCGNYRRDKLGFRDLIFSKRRPLNDFFHQLYTAVTVLFSDRLDESIQYCGMHLHSIDYKFGCADCNSI